MNLGEEIRQSVFHISDEKDFDNLALKIFRFQYGSNAVYREFSQLLKDDPSGINDWQNIPFLPVSLFKDHKIISGEGHVIRKVFTSSGTTGNIPSQHFIKDLKLYEESFTRSFGIFYGDPGEFRFLALLPGYLERQGSSLVYMLDYLIRKTEQHGSGFFLHDLDSLKERLHETRVSEMTLHHPLGRRNGSSSCRRPTV